MPFFFLAIGLKTVFSLSDPVVWTIFVLALAAGFGSRLLTTTVIARAMGESWTFGGMLGVLLQTKGLMALVLVSAFNDRGLFGRPAFSALVVMVMVSTALTMPLWNILSLTIGDRLDRPKGPSGQGKR